MNVFNVNLIKLLFYYFIINVPSGMQADIIDQKISQKGAGCRGAVAANGNKNCNNMVANEDRMPLTDHDEVTCQSNSKDLEKLWTILASKDRELSRAALTVVLSKRDKLV